MRQKFNPRPSLPQTKALIDADDFAVRARVPGDPFFYVRLDKETKLVEGQDTIIVSDLNPGSQSSAFTGATLAELMTYFPFADQILIGDIYPGWQDDPSFEVELERRVTKTRAILSVALNRDEMTFALLCQINKYNLVVKLF